MSILQWMPRLQAVGATTSEQASITAAYEASTSGVQSALDTLIAGVANTELGVMLTNWRNNGGPFAAGFPGGGLPFGARAPLLTGNPADDAEAIGAGTGTKLSVSGGGGGGLPGVTVTGTPSAGEVLTATSSSAAGWATGSGGTAASTTYNSTSATGPTEGTSDVQHAILALDADLASDDPQIAANTAAIAANAAQIAANTALAEANTALIALTTGNQSPAVTGIWGPRLTGFGSIRFVSALGALRGHWQANTAYAQGDDVDTNVGTLLTTALSTGSAATSLAVNAPENAIPSSVPVTVTDPTGVNMQTFTTSAATTYSGTSIAVTSQTPNYNYPVGSSVVYANPGNFQALVACTSNTAQPVAAVGVLGGTIALGTRVDSSASGTSSSSTITDSAIVSGDAGRSVTASISGTPTMIGYVGTVTAGTSFVLVNAASGGTAVDPPGTVSGITLGIGTGITSIPLSSPLVNPSGTQIGLAAASNVCIITQDGTQRQGFSMTSAYSVGGTSVPVTSKVPSYPFPPGSIVASSWTQVPEVDGDRLALQA